ncbi:hypothetical protein CRE_12464 [Caenorhabditis remanei]|uniref:F-box domain-containing protein n=1 Tax=Caenorhabditis remanei TaxID=31234 RepID=E3M717_CAERE|nr:hypothetical protein CRE_12464 [Caenorhabditis remanei]
MTVSFPLLRLPAVALREVLLNFGTMDLLEFSFTSTRVRDCVFRSARLRVIEHNVEFLKEYPHIVTVFKNDDGLHEHKLEWEFVGGQLAGKSHQEERRIGCHRFEKCHKNGNIIQCHFHNPEFGASVVFNHISKIFQGPVNLFLDLSHIRNLYSILLNQNISECQKLEVYEGYNNEQNDEDLYGILDMVNIGKELKAYVTNQDEIDFDQICHLESLTLENANWMTLPDLISLNCRYGNFINHKFGPFDVNSFAENWYNSTNRTLAKMQLGWDVDTELDLKKSKLEWKKWDPKIRSRCFYDPSEPYHSNRIDCSEGYDITRSDGLTATILVRDGFECYALFLVWHDPYPEKTRLNQLRERMAEEFKKFENVFESHRGNEKYVTVGKFVKSWIESKEIAHLSFEEWKYALDYITEDTCHLYNRIVKNVNDIQKEIKLWESVDNTNNCIL